MAVGLTSVLMLWIIPAFERIYTDLGGVLPGPTRILINVSRGVCDNILLVTLAAMAAGLLFTTLKRTDHGSFVWDSFKLRVPVFGKLLQKSSLCRFSESLAQMLICGIPILPAMELAAYTTDNKALERGALKARTAMESGNTLSSSLKTNSLYPALLIHMLQAGEKTGKIDEMLLRVSKFYRNEVDVTLKGLSSLIEPLLIVILGAIVGSIVVAMFLPIFTVHQLISM